MNFTPALAALLAASSGSPVLAIPANQISEKFDTVIIFAPVSSTEPSEPQPLNFQLDGQSRSVYFAAFSPSAVQNLMKDRLVPKDPELANSLKFAPFSLSKFDSIVQPALADDKNNRVIYVPDPAQVPMAEKLLIEQGAKPADAAKLTTQMPVIFCPEPAIKATPDKGALSGQSFVPCSTDHQTVQSIIDKGIATNPELKVKSPRLVAIPITNFAKMLAEGTDKSVGEIRVLTTPSSLEAVGRLRKANGNP